MQETPLGTTIDAVDGVAKVTGALRYTADIAPEGGAPLHGVLVETLVPSGKIVAVRDAATNAAPGVRLVLTHRNMPRINPFPGSEAGGLIESRGPLQDDLIRHSGQWVALVVADTLERATHAASLLEFEIQREPFDVSLRLDDPRAVTPPKSELDAKGPVSMGDFGAAWEASEARIEREYRTPTEHHNPMETIATTAEWHGESLFLRETSRQVMIMQGTLAAAFGIPVAQVRLVCEHVGGAFGSKGFLYGHMVLTAAAARTLGHPVRTVTTRRQMFASVGHRPRTVQGVALGASADGRLRATRHRSVGDTSPVSGYVEACTLTTRKLYATDALETSQGFVSLALPSSCPMRGPGETPGPFALESAMDELAVELGMDPVELRLRNGSTVDSDSGKPWSQQLLRRCFEEGAARFGWAGRDPRPGTMREGRERIGWGCAAVAYRADMSKTTCRASMGKDGVAEFRMAGSDVGQGARTAMAGVAAASTGLPASRVRVLLGDSAYPPAPGAGGSSSAASLGNAIVAAAAALKRAAGTEDLAGFRGEAEAEATQAFDAEGADVAFHSWGAVFAEVAVDAELGSVRCRRVVGVYDVGRVLDLRRARAQLEGGIVGAVGMALTEETAVDERHGLYATRDLAEYHVPTLADAPRIDVRFLDVPDARFGALGAHGVGEVGMAGTPAAIANAVWHATGRRVRSLPITLDKIL